MRIFILSAWLLAFTGCQAQIQERPLGFLSRIEMKPPIKQPDQPFVLIFMDGGCDRCRYGFVSDGVMTKDAWKKVFNHVGHLTAYSVFKPQDDRLWGADNRDVAVAAAQELGRETGGGIMGVPNTAKAIENVKEAYRSDLGARITHYFHDDEQPPGTPGGGGLWRLKVEAGRGGCLVTAPSSDFFPKVEQPGDYFSIQFGLALGDYIFGGDATLFGQYDGGFFNEMKAGWAVRLVNAAGASGNSRIVFTTGSGESVSSVPINFYVGMMWLPVTIELRPSRVLGSWDVTVSIAGLGKSQATIKTPRSSEGGFIVGSRSALKRDVDLDDITLTSGSEKVETVIAKYGFEDVSPHETTKPKDLERTADASGRNHHLVANGKGLAYTSTDGISTELGSALKEHLVDALKAARAQQKRADPLLITNWRTGDVPGRVGAWKRFGITHGSTEFYLYDKPSGSFSKVGYVLSRRIPIALRAQTDGGSWGHAWLGNVHPDKAALTPDDFGSLVVMAVLEGYRWFSVFTAMSEGHLAAADRPYDEKARINADAIYAMALAASWFQSTRQGLEGSVYQALDASPKLEDVIIRSRVNVNTHEAWFAAVPAVELATRDLKDIELTMPRTNGTITDLTTGRTTQISNGRYRLVVSGAGPVHPYYFKPTN